MYNGDKEGTVTAVENHGTIVILRHTGGTVYFDHRPFSNLMAALGLRSVDRLIGQRIEVTDSPAGDFVCFPDLEDEEEDARRYERGIVDA